MISRIDRHTKRFAENGIRGNLVSLRFLQTSRQKRTRYFYYETVTIATRPRQLNVKTRASTGRPVVGTFLKIAIDALTTPTYSTADVARTCLSHLLTVTKVHTHGRTLIRLLPAYRCQRVNDVDMLGSDSAPPDSHTADLTAEPLSWSPEIRRREQGMERRGRAGAGSLEVGPVSAGALSAVRHHTWTGRPPPSPDAPVARATGAP